MKKVLTFIFVLCLSVGSLAGCGKNEKVISFYVPDGAPLIGAYRFFENDEIIEGYTLEANLVTGANVEPLIAAKTPDIIIAPIVFCANSFYLTDKEYVFAGVSVFGLNHIVTNDDSGVQNLSELVGETVYAFQKNGTPSQTFRALLDMYGVAYKEFTAEDKTAEADKVNIEYLPSPAAVRNAMTVGLEGRDASFYKFGLLAEPVVTAAEQAGTLKRVFDLQQLWKDIEGSSYPQAGVLIRKSLINADNEFINKVRAAFVQISAYAKSNTSEAAEFIKDEINSSELPDKEILAAFLNSEVGNNAIAFRAGENTNSAVISYLSAIGVAVPDNEFFTL